MRVVTRLLPTLLLLTALVAGLLAVPARAEDDANPPVPEAVRKASIKKLGKQLRKTAQSPHAPKHKADILKLLDSLEVLGGYEAGVAALEAVALEDEEVRDRAFELAETEHHAKLVKPLGAMLEAKRYRKDQDARRRAARSPKRASAGNPLS